MGYHHRRLMVAITNTVRRTTRVRVLGVSVGGAELVQGPLLLNFSDQLSCG
jgi:hypothetical protein